MYKVYKKYIYFAKRVLCTLGAELIFLIIVITVYSNFFATEVKVKEI